MSRDLYLEDWKFQGRVTNVVDGDTVDIRIDFGFGLRQEMRFRLASPSGAFFDAPESWRPKSEAEERHGDAAKAFLKDLIGGRSVTLYSVKKGKYRYVAIIHYMDDQGNELEVTETMEQNGFEKLTEEEYAKLSRQES